jgi:hypothetical protein
MPTIASAAHALVYRGIHCELCIGISQQTQLSHHLCHFSPFNKYPRFVDACIAKREHAWALSLCYRAECVPGSLSTGRESI